MPLAERVAEIRAQQKRREVLDSKKVIVQEAATSVTEEQARAANLDAYNTIMQALGLEDELGVLAAVEGLKRWQLKELITEPIAEEVELRLQWEGEPKREYQEGVIVTPPKGFFSISIIWNRKNVVTVSGEEEVGSIKRLYKVNEEVEEKLDDLIAQAYLKPRWNEQIDEIMVLQTRSEAPTESLGMEPDETDIPF